MLHNSTLSAADTLPAERIYQKPYTFDDAVLSFRAGHDVERATATLLACCTQEEQLWMLDGDEPFWEGLRGILHDRYNRKPFVMGAIPRLNIPGIRFTDGPRGIVMYESTCFPVSMARGATWDVELERRIGKAIGLEGRAQGANYFAGICINLPRHPAWGRIQETYGEDPLLLGEFGVALHRGVHENLMTCVKHFALNSMENARFKVDVRVDDAALHEVYLPHFRRLVDAGVDSVMSSYNSVRDELAGQNDELLNKILRGQWGFDGFVLSDFIFGLRDAVKSVKNGLDIEAPFRQQRARELPGAVERRELEWSDVNQSCLRILRKQLQYAANTSGGRPISPSVVFSNCHRALARKAASQGMVLLKNDAEQPLLPVNPASIKSMAVIGRLTNKNNTGDQGSSAVFAPKVITAYEGLKAALPDAAITLDDSDDAHSAAKAASGADVTICIVGYDAADEGEYVVPSFAENEELLDLLPPTTSDAESEVEATVKGQPRSDDSSQQGIVPGAGGDRRSLRLRDADVKIIEAVTRVSSRVVVCIVASGAVVMNDWVDKVSTLLMAWYSGCEGGHALADVLLGRVDASGRLPFSIPISEEHLPHFDIDARSIKYDRWFGQRLLDKLGVQAHFPLGYGLSYTQWTIEKASTDAFFPHPSREAFMVRVAVKNTGARRGRHVVQVYGLLEEHDFPSRVLLGFLSVELDAHQSREFDVSCSIRPMQRWTSDGFRLVSNTVKVEVAAFAGDQRAIRIMVPLT